MLSPQPYLFLLFPSLGLLKYHWYYVEGDKRGGKEGNSEGRKGGKGERFPFYDEELRPR